MLTSTDGQVVSMGKYYFITGNNQSEKLGRINFRIEYTGYTTCC